MDPQQDQDLTQTLVESFNALADEVQNLGDRQTILEHKLRFAHEQFQYLGDKYAPAAPEISETLASLQLPPDPHNLSLANSTFVPLPKRGSSDANSKHQIALIIRQGRRVASSLSDPSKSSRSLSLSAHSRERDRDDSRPPTTMTSLSTILEQDFTVQGKKGHLNCPFSSVAPRRHENQPAHDLQENDGTHRDDSDGEPRLPGAHNAPVNMEVGESEVNGDGENQQHVVDNSMAQARRASSSHPPEDPICAAMMVDDAASQPTNSAVPKCPIRYLDNHSPEEIAQYVETHKHELPRSHEVCVRRYQHSEDHIKKLDAKWANRVSMWQGLGKIHQPMLPDQDTRPQSDVMPNVTDAYDDRVVDWAQTVSASNAHHPHLDDVDRPVGEIGERQMRDPADVNGSHSVHDEDDDLRQSHFDRDLKEIRVGESPSRPWGISVPHYDDITSPGGGRPSLQRPESPPPAPVPMPTSLNPQSHDTPSDTPAKCPFDHTKLAQMMGREPTLKDETASSIRLADIPPTHRPTSPPQPGPRSLRPSEPASTRPVFLSTSEAPMTTQHGQPSMLFTGPVFIGYPMEQAVQFMQQYQNQQHP